MKRIVSFILAVACLFSLLAVIPVSAATTNDMEIYGLYLDSDGDSVLLKSSGKWMLMDTGREDAADSLIAQLKAYGVKNLDIYISHLHPDHYGGVAAIGQSGDFKVGKIYLPDLSIGKEYEHQEYFTKKLYEWSGASEVQYLKKGSTFNHGSCTAVVLGPVGSYTPDQFPKDEEGNLTHYLNNYSLTTKITCGGISYLTCGDIEKEEEEALCKKYKGKELNADILKLSHHGLPTSNFEKFLAKVSPEHSFAVSTGYTEIVKGSSGNMVRQTYTSRDNASAHGFVYMVGDEKKNFGVKVKSGNISLYRGDSKLEGWVKVKGGNGVTQKENIYYIKDGKTLKGIQTVDGKKYHFSTGGCAIIGYYDSEKKYKPWRTMDDGMRAFTEQGVMYTGFKAIDGNTFYFDPKTGIKRSGTKKWDIQKIGKEYYALNANGVVRKGGWLAYTVKGKKNYRYFGSDGAMKTGWFTLDKKKYYLDPETGFRVMGFQKIGKKRYYFTETKSAAYLQKNCWRKFGSKYRYFNSKGEMVTGWYKVDGKQYYFNSNGYRVVGFQKIGKKYYYFTETKSAAYLQKSCWRKFGSKYRYFNSKGEMVTGWYTVKGKKYYLDPKTGYRAVGVKKIGKKRYYFEKTNSAAYLPQNCWRKFGTKYRYINSDGTLITGWKTINGSKYYFDKDGYRVTGTRKIGKKTYTFSGSGKLKS